MSYYYSTTSEPQRAIVVGFLKCYAFYKTSTQQICRCVLCLKRFPEVFIMVLVCIGFALYHWCGKWKYVLDVLCTTLWIWYFKWVNCCWNPLFIAGGRASPPCNRILNMFCSKALGINWKHVIILIILLPLSEHKPWCFEAAVCSNSCLSFAGSSGGICEKSKLYSDGKKKSLNTGIITVQNYASHVPPKVSHITFAHEVGHNFGSPVSNLDVQHLCTVWRNF